MKRSVWILLFLGLVLRLLFIPQPGFEADVSYWKFWGLAAADKGVIWLANNTNYNYPAGFAWILWLIGKTYRLLGNPEDYFQFWSSNNYLFLLITKILPILADLGVAYILAQWSLILSFIYLFHPAVWFDSAWWGQVDSFLFFFLVAGLYFLKQKKTLLATSMVIIGFLMKFQMMIVLPIYFLYILRRYSVKELGKNLALATAIFLLGNLPFIVSGNWPTVISLITRNADWFPVLSLRAFNLWWLYSQGQGLTVSDKILVIGTLNAKLAGLILFSLAYALPTLLVLLKPNFKNLLVGLILATFAFFLFPTQGHDRYLLPTLILLLLSLHFSRQKLFKQLFGWLSLTTILNLNLSMLAEYPQSGLPIVSWFNFPSLSLIISGVNLGLFLILAVHEVKNLVRYYRR
jgi:Gpi18-like mannosyltransferase